MDEVLGHYSSYVCGIQDPKTKAFISFINFSLVSQYIDLVYVCISLLKSDKLN